MGGGWQAGGRFLGARGGDWGEDPGAGSRLQGWRWGAGPWGAGRGWGRVPGVQGGSGGRLWAGPWDAGRGFTTGAHSSARRPPPPLPRAAAEAPEARGQPSSGRRSASSAAAGERGPGPGPGPRPRRGAPPPVCLQPLERGEGQDRADRGRNHEPEFPQVSDPALL